MRGMFTCGVIDTFMEAGIHFDGLVGVSAGAAFGCNYKSHQIGRALRYNKAFAADARYMGIRSLATSGNLINAEFAYHVVPTQYDIFDSKTFEQDPMSFHLVCTDVQTGKPVYHELTKVDFEALEWIRASASMPGVSKPVCLDGMALLDGGISDSIPLRYFQSQGYERNVVILTQPKGYYKQTSRLQNILLRILASKYPAIRRAMKVRHDMYNAQLHYIAAEEQAGRALLIYPERPLGISRVCSNASQLQQTYDLGQRHAQRVLEQVKQFLNA